ncbi:MAG: UDP-glucose/GDP-mannose dehydrogenase family protein [Candidatus Hadarchaeales archaeon]
MNILVIGAGYVGLTTGVGFASLGHKVVCADIDKKKVDMLNQGKSPIYEEGLDELLKNVGSKKLFSATTDVQAAVKDAEIIFMCVGTPSKKTGEIDLRYLLQAARSVGDALGEVDEYKIVAVKSTVVPGATEEKVIPLLEKSSGMKAGKDFGVCVNPEFLKEGSALKDFFHPDRIVIGELNPKSGNALARLYRNFKCPFIRTNLRTAEMIKYASNAFLAAKVSLINEIGNICKRLGIDVYEVAKGVGADPRISPHFLRAGIGFGGSCFPKDLKALIARAEELGYRPKILRSVIEVNEKQPLRLLELLKKHIPNLRGKTIGILGLSFKPGTDDIREAPSIKIVRELLKEGARVKAYDPKAMENFRRLFPDIHYCNAKEVLKSDAVLILTEWEEFHRLDYRGKVVIDGRKIDEARKAKIYEGVCW